MFPEIIDLMKSINPKDRHQVISSSVNVLVTNKIKDKLKNIRVVVFDGKKSTLLKMIPYIEKMPEFAIGYDTPQWGLM